MQNKTVEMIQKLQSMLQAGKITEFEVPLDELVACVLEEFKLYQSLYPERECREVEQFICGITADEKEIPMEKKLEVLVTILYLFPAQAEQKMNELINFNQNERIQKIIDAYNNADAWVQYLSKQIREEMETKDFFNFKYQDSKDPEIEAILDFVNRNGKPEIFNYDFVATYDDVNCDIQIDEENNMPYILYFGRRMYYPKDWETQKIKDWHRSIIFEQDPKSPHYYKREGFDVREGDVVLDAGAGEGNFTLSVIDKASKIYIVEADPEWIEPLHQTLKNDMDKVVFVNKYLSGKDTDQEVTIDSIMQGGELNFMKMDIEGFEIPALEGAKRALEGKDIRCALCTYHKRNDYRDIQAVLESHQFKTEHSDGYMYIRDDLNAVLKAELRRGIIYGARKID